MTWKVDPHSRAGRLLALLRSTPDEPWEITALAAAIGEPANLAAQTLASATRSCGKNSPWRHVDRPARGLWIYRTTSHGGTPPAGPEPAPPPEWTPVGDAGPDLLVLRGPDGQLWLARRLADAVTVGPATAGR